MKLYQNRCQKNGTKYFFSNIVVSKWNALPMRVPFSETLVSFKDSYGKFYQLNREDARARLQLRI